MLRNKQLGFLIAAIISMNTATLALAAEATPPAEAQTIGDLLNGEKPKKDVKVKKEETFLSAPQPAAVVIPDDQDMPSIAGLMGIGKTLSVKFMTSEGAISVPGPNSQINAYWLYLHPDVDFSVIIQNIETKKTYRITMKVPEDVEYGQKIDVQEKKRKPSLVETSLPALPNFNQQNNLMPGMSSPPKPY